MNREDIINMYKNSYSVNYISNYYYKSKNNNTGQVRQVGNDIIISKPKIKKDEARLEVIRYIYEYQMNILRKD